MSRKRWRRLPGDAAEEAWQLGRSRAYWGPVGEPLAPNLAGLPLLHLSITPACAGTFPQVNSPPNGGGVKP